MSFSKLKKKKREFPLFEKEWVSPVKCHDYTMFVY